MIKKIRLDSLLVSKQLIQNKNKAKAIIMAGEVFVDDVKYDKPGTYFSENVNIRLKSSKIQYVSRGGLKLQAAITKNSIVCQGLICLDVGSSTGGFTECLLQNGVSKVFAVDVGYGQLAWKLRNDPRVVVIERTNIRYINPDLITDKIDIVTIDVSFISLKIVIPAIIPFLSKKGIIIALIKPQFEVGKENVGKKGVVKLKSLHEEVLKMLIKKFEALGLICGQVIQSPLLGAKGNREFLILLNK